MKSSTDDTAYTVNVTSLTWTNNEETVWEGEATDTVGISNPASYPSYEEPYDNLTWNTSAYNKNNAILIRVYVKAVATEDSLLVRYIDKATGSVFYDYNITVKENTIFDANIGLDEEKQEVLNGSVENYYGNTQKISAELSEMSEIGASFKNGKYKCVEVKRVSDKIVELYYEFNNVMDFVVDFGVPLHLSPRDIGIPDDQRTWIKASVSGATQGKATIGVGEGLTYTPTEIMTEPELLSVGLTETNDATSSYQIRLYPATNVLYEEGVLTQAETTNSYVDWTRTTGISTKQQTVEKLGAENVHGYDSAYDKDTTFSADSYYHATLSETNKFTKNLTFTFTGTGFDVISECGPQTGALVVAVKNSAGKTVEVAVVDTLFNGDSKYITGTSGILDYQVPVYRNLGLEYGTYTVNIGSAYVANRPTDAASVASLHSNDTYSIVSDILDAFGYDDFNVEDVELVYTDENSVLNGGTGVVSEKAVTAYSANLAEEYAAEPYANSTTQDVYVDGVRIYGTLANDPGYATAEADVKYDSVYEFAKNSAVDLDDYIENALIYVEYDGDQPVYNIADYKQQGPENEVYLTPSSGIAFELSGYTEGDTVQVSLKAINGAVSVENALPANGSIPETSTEMYYTVEPKKMEDESGRWYVLIVNSNNSKGILSISNLKISDGINVVITPELKDYILNKDDVAEFIPETFTAKAPLNLQQTHNSTISISTSTDANCVKVIIGDEVVKLTPNNKKAVSRGKAKLYTYNYALFGYNLSAGKNVFKLVAVSADTGKESAPIEVTVTVTE